MMLDQIASLGKFLVRESDLPDLSPTDKLKQES